MKRVSLATCLVLTCGIVFGVARSLPAPPQPQPGDYQMSFWEGQKGRGGTGTTSCGACHAKAGVSFGNLPLDQNDTWLGLNMDTGRPEGRHAHAYKTLEGEWSQNIARRLDTVDGQGADATKRADCLSCHSFDYNLVASLSPQDRRNETKVKQAERNEAKWRMDGVGCEACHGLGQGYERNHPADDWPTRSREKWADSGMYDTRNLVQWAERCNECHVGSAGKVMTHTLLGAGHPDISSYELVTYLEYVPKHWQDEDYPNHEVDGNYSHARAWAVGQLTSLRDAVRRVADWATGWEEGGEAEFSLFECYSCHQNLTPSSPSWKAERQQLAIPGEPIWNGSNWAMVKHLVEQFDSSAMGSWKNGIEELMKSTSVKRPDPQRAKTAALALDVLCNNLLARLSPNQIQGAAGMSASQVKSLLKGIADDALYQVSVGPRAAEQAYRAFVVLYGWSWAKADGGSSSAMDRAVNELGEIVLTGKAGYPPMSQFEEKGLYREAWKLNETTFKGGAFLEKMKEISGMLE